jgi:hypothetical protein
MLKVIGAGFPRTGTTSLKAALDRLGFGACHHMYEVLSQPGQVERWLPVVSGGPIDWEHVFDGYRSAVDWPASFFWRELTEAYPDAKVILTVRDAHHWYASLQTMLAGIRGALNATEVAPMMESMTRFRPVMDLMGRATFGDDWSWGAAEDEEHAVEVFRRHIETVQESLPARRLLVFEAGQGWDPLCEFLGVEPPEGEPFPHLNDTETMRRNLERSRRGDQVVSPFG